ncbi:MAG TPA: hypothetical protein VMU92_11565 [Acidobacteriaceae bacterium]|nr:hypothetical protein [Acidobacteriaceae bacterium]
MGATLPGGLFLTNLDRPETIGLVVAFSLIYLWRNDRSGLAKVLLLGSTGALFLIHPYIGIVEFLLFVFLLVWSPAAKSKPGVIAGGALLAAAIVAGCAAYMQHLDPTTLHRFLSHALGAGTGAGAVLKGQSANANKGLLHNYAAAGKRYFNAANLLSAVPLLMLLCSLGVIALYLAKKRTENAKKRDALQLGCLFCILFLFPAAVFLPQRNYFAASSALLFAVITSAGYSLSDRMRHTRAPLLLLVVAVFFSLPAFSLRLIATREFKASYLRSSEQAARVKKIFGAQGDPQPRLLIDPTHFFVYKPYFEYLYNYQYLRPEDSTSEFQGLVRCYTGELAFSRSELAWPAPLHKSDWKLIDGDAGVERTTLFGHPIQRRNWSWACDVYERKNAKP